LSFPSDRRHLLALRRPLRRLKQLARL
jgi:hypothetical protein